jgi:hypothetical protein
MFTDISSEYTVLVINPHGEIKGSLLVIGLYRRRCFVISATARAYPSSTHY